MTPTPRSSRHDAKAMRWIQSVLLGGAGTGCCGRPGGKERKSGAWRLG